jgi:SAM-dependent methyltransferase
MLRNELTDPGQCYRADLALVHQQGFGFHADLCAPGILRLLEPILARRGLVVELGCGSGRLTRHLVDAGHTVVATDAWLRSGDHGLRARKRLVVAA